MTRRSRLNHLGVFILLVGMSVGCFLYWRTLQNEPATDDQQTLADIENSRVYQQAVERNVGSFGLLMSQMSDAVAKLAEPRPFALTVMVLSNVAAVGCFLIATRLPHVDRLPGAASTV